MLPIEEIETNRLRLRKFTPALYKQVFEQCNKEAQMQVFAFEEEATLEKEKEKYHKGLATHNRSFVHFKLFEKSSGLHIGNCGFHTWYTEHFRAEIGYDLLSDTYKNKGFMTEALQRILHYGFTEMKLNRVEALIGPANIPSQKLVQKFGFSKEGYLREHYCKNGDIQDSIFYALLKREYAL